LSLKIQFQNVFYSFFHLTLYKMACATSHFTSKVCTCVYNSMYTLYKRDRIFIYSKGKGWRYRKKKKINTISWCEFLNNRSMWKKEDFFYYSYLSFQSRNIVFFGNNKKNIFFFISQNINFVLIFNKLIDHFHFRFSSCSSLLFHHLFMHEARRSSQ
jgi:hypothetical protein